MTVSFVGLLLLLLVGAICGIVAEGIVGFSPGGFLVSAFLGFVGAWLGTWMAREMGLPSLLAVRIEGHTFEIIWAILGATVLVALLALLRRGPYRRVYR